MDGWNRMVWYGMVGYGRVWYSLAITFFSKKISFGV